MESAKPTEPPSPDTSDSAPSGSSKTTPPPKKKNKTKWKDTLPQASNGRIDLHQLKNNFLGSEHLTWRSYAESLGIIGNDYVYSVNKLPIREWVQEKMGTIETKHREKLLRAVCNIRSDFEIAVINVLKDYPAYQDEMTFLLRSKIREHADRQRADASYIKSVKGQELAVLQNALSMATQNKHKSLLLDNYSVEMMRSDITLGIKEGREPDDSKTGIVQGQEFNFNLIGGKQLTANQLEKMFKHYLDPAIPEPEREVNPNAPPPIEEDFSRPDDF